MKVLLDSCVWGKVAPKLRDAGYDAVWVGDWPEDPGDEEILAIAFADSRVLVTLDKDFGGLAVLRKSPHCGILRIVGFSARTLADACMAILSEYRDELLAGAIITAEPGRLRIRPRS